MRTNYIGHDLAYQRLRQQPDRNGWDTADQLNRDLEILTEMIQWPWFPTSGRLLEMGCGAGNISLELARRGYQVDGIDISPAAISWARENAAKEGSQVTFNVSDVLSVTGHEDQSFDVVLDGHCLHCIIGTDRLLFFSSAHRLLRTGGSLCVRTMCNAVPKTVAERSRFDPITRCFMSGEHTTRYIGLANDIIKEIITAGFDVVQMQVLPASVADEEDLDELLLLARKR